jgi:hypothetical protein
VSDQEQPTWAVQLRSRHTGAETVLGMRYDTRAEAEAAAQEECQRCNSTSVIPVWPDQLGGVK